MIDVDVTVDQLVAACGIESASAVGPAQEGDSVIYFDDLAQWIVFKRAMNSSVIHRSV